MKKEDLRIVKTKRDLRIALIYLLKKDSFEKLTVGDICSRAMVNRMTFYKHFKDKYDLLEHTINFLIEQMIANISEYATPTENFDSFMKFCVLLSKTIVRETAEKKDVFIALYRSDSGTVYDILTKTMRKYINMLVKEVCRFKKLKYSIETTTEFLSGGIIQLVCYWLFNMENFDQHKFEQESMNFTRELLANNLLFKD